jgi:hypothetical protein
MAGAQTVVLHLRNGDRLAGTIVSQDSNWVVITTSWAKDLVVPADQIASREALGPTAPPTNGIVVAITNRADFPPGTNLVSAPDSGTTNAGTGGSLFKRWNGELAVGAVYLRGVNKQQVYYGRMKVNFDRPYDSNPQKHLHNLVDFSIDYGWITGTNNETLVSADRLDASDKITADISGPFYVYTLAGAGYDSVKEISFRDEIGPGLGYHLFQRTNLTVNLEAGLDYQGQYLMDAAQTAQRYVFYRLAHEVTWKLDSQLTFTEKFEYFPQVDSRNYHSRFEATFSYLWWKHFTLNLTALNTYDSNPASGIANNDFQLRSSLGVKF